jgi:hypothetical protein
MAKTKKMAFGGMGNAAMSSRGGIPASVRNSIRNAPTAPMQPVMARPAPPIVEKPKVIQPGPSPVNYAQLEAEKRAAQPAIGSSPFNTAISTPTGIVSGGLGAGPIGGNAPTGKSFDFGSIGMSGPSIAQQTSGYKKGGKVCYAGGGKAEEKKEAPIPAETLASMRRQAAQEKADRKQAEEQKAGEKEVRTNMGRLGFKKGGAIKASKMGAVKVAKPTMRSASSRADGIAIRGKTRA